MMSGPSSDKRDYEPTLATGADAPMSAEQAALLRRLAHDAFDIEAFGEHLTQSEAARRIATLQAKLKLQGEPPHTL
jgi:hypothetical protein